MKVEIKNRKQIEDFTFTDRTALISITEYNYKYAELKSSPTWLLQLKFDDVDNYVFVDTLGREPTEEERIEIEKRYHMFSDEQSDEIAEFYFNVKNGVDTIICQCEYGMSRSAAVAAAILEYENKSGIDIFSNDYYCPNRVVFRKVLKSLRKIGDYCG